MHACDYMCVSLFVSVCIFHAVKRALQRELQTLLAKVCCVCVHACD